MKVFILLLLLMLSFIILLSFCVFLDKPLEKKQTKKKFYLGRKGELPTYRCRGKEGCLKSTIKDIF